MMSYWINELKLSKRLYLNCISIRNYKVSRPKSTNSFFDPFDKTTIFPTFEQLKFGNWVFDGQNSPKSAIWCAVAYNKMRICSPIQKGFLDLVSSTFPQTFGALTRLLVFFWSSTCLPSQLYYGSSWARFWASAFWPMMMITGSPSDASLALADRNWNAKIAESAWLFLFWSMKRYDTHTK